MHEFLTGKRPYEASKLQKYHEHKEENTLELEALMKLTYLTNDCKYFVRDLLQPDPKKRLGYKNDMAMIYNHTWLKNKLNEDEKVDLLDAIISNVPGFQENVLMNGNKLNISVEEASSILRQHYMTHNISEDVQKVFQK